MDLIYNNKIVRVLELDGINCNLCNSILEIKKQNIINKCSNSNCLSNLPKQRKMKLKSIYSNSLFEEYVAKVKKNNKSRLKISYWTEKGYTEEESINIIKEIQSKISKSVKNRARPYDMEYYKSMGLNEVDAKLKVDAHIRKTTETSIRRIEYWINKGLSESDAILKISEIQKSVSKKANIENIKESSKFSKKYWIKNGKSDDEAAEIIKLQNTRSKEYFINKYGDVEGHIKYSDMIDKRKITFNDKTDIEKSRINKSKGLTKEKLIEKFGIVKTMEILKKRINNFKCIKYSKVSYNLFKTVIEKLNINSNECFFGETEKRICTKSRIIYPDFIYKNKIIEFNGSIYHADPRLFKCDDQPNPFNSLKSEDIWNIDKMRIEILKSLNYDILIIWELDYKNNKELVMNNVINFLNK